jgi:hypothetical protein
MCVFSLEAYLNDPTADISVSVVIKQAKRFIFIVQPKNRWKKEGNKTIIPFGGIGGKLEKGETLDTALQRECREEIGTDVHIINNRTGEICVINPSSKNKIFKLHTDSIHKNNPIFIFRNPRAEIGRKAYTNIIVFQGTPLNHTFQLHENPALITMSQDLLETCVKKRDITVSEFCDKGGNIQGIANIPLDGILYPTPTPRGLSYLIKNSILF